MWARSTVRESEERDAELLLEGNDLREMREGLRGGRGGAFVERVGWGRRGAGGSRFMRGAAG